MVWPLEVTGDEAHLIVATIFGHSLFMGNRLSRILMSDSSQQNRIYRQRRPFHAYAVESDTRGDHACGFYPVFDRSVPRRGATLESYGGVRMSDSGRIFRIYEVTLGKRSDDARGV